MPLNSIVTKIGDGVTTQFSVSFTGGYMDPAHVRCRVGIEVAGDDSPIYRAISFVSPGIIDVAGAPAGVGVDVRFERNTPIQVAVNDFQDGSVLDEENLDNGFLQLLMGIQEARDQLSGALDADKSAEAAALAVIEAQAAEAQALVHRNAVQAAQVLVESQLALAVIARAGAETAETGAASSAATASGAATAASTSAGTAGGHAANASTSETNAANSAAAASGDASTASTAATNAATSETNASADAATASTKAAEAVVSADEAAASAAQAALFDGSQLKTDLEAVGIYSPLLNNKSIGAIWTADATSNLAKFKQLCLDSAANSVYADFPRGRINVDGPLEMPVNGGYTLDNPHLLIQYDSTVGVFKSSTPDTRMKDCGIRGLTIEFDEFTAAPVSADHPAGGPRPYQGNGFQAAFQDSILDGIQVLNYWNDQPFLLALYNSSIDVERSETDHKEGGTGCLRILGGNNYSCIVRWANPGDDLLMAVPSQSGVLSNLDCTNGWYELHSGETNARLAIAITEPGMPSTLRNLTFRLNGKTLAQHGTGGGSASILIQNQGTGVMDNIHMFGTIDETNRRATGNAVSGGAVLGGNITNCGMDVSILNPDKVVGQTKAVGSNVPRDCYLYVRSNAAPATATSQAVKIAAGINLDLRARIVAPTDALAIVLSGGDKTTIDKSVVRAIQSGGGVGVRGLAAATKTRIKGSSFEGAGTAVSFASGVATDFVTECDFGGQGTVLGSVITRDNTP